MSSRWGNRVCADGAITMRELFEILFWRLSDKNLTPVELWRLIRDVANIIGDGGDCTVGSVNQKLEILGWKREFMDPRSFELILHTISP